MTRIYLAGPMSGLPDENYPAFNSAAAHLRTLGFDVENPAENTTPACGSWAGYMRLAITQLLSCDCVVFLPGWSVSKGACIEQRLAADLCIPGYMISRVLRDPEAVKAFTTMVKNSVAKGYSVNKVLPKPNPEQGDV